ncbi:pyridoxal-dependent decarboxylase, partial [Apiospora arundinis]
NHPRRDIIVFPQMPSNYGGLTKNMAHINDMVLEAMRAKLSHQWQRHRSEPFCVMDLGDVYDEYQRWCRVLPDVKAFYAVKCNSDAQVVKLLAGLKSGFDCASQTEMELVLSEGVPPERIIFANPCKKISDLEYAQKSGVRNVTFDNEAELYKIREWLPDAELVLRCRASDASASYRLCDKYGATAALSVKLLQCVKSLGLSVIGVSFHIGSNAKDPSAFDAAIQTCRDVFETGLGMGHDMRLLDIGGGFSAPTFDAMACVIRESIDSHFSDIPVEVIAEPGRLFVEGALTVACGVIGLRDADENTEDEEDERRHMLYLNDGIWGVFSSNLFEPGPLPKVLRLSGVFYPPESEDGRYEDYTLWGPTCDSFDCVAKSVALPESLDIGDWLYFPDMGGESALFRLPPPF